MLDRAAGDELTGFLARYRQLYDERRRLEQEFDHLTAQAQERAREIDLLRFGLAEINRVEPLVGEDEALRAEAEHLRTADDRRQAVFQAVVALAGDDAGQQPSAFSLLTSARQVLAGLAPVDSAAQALTDQAQTVLALTSDLVSQASSYLADLEADPVRLEQIAARLATLQSLTRKYGADATAVVAWAEQAAQRLVELEGTDQRLDALSVALDHSLTELTGLADQLSDLRQAAAERIQAAVEAELRALAMPQARLSFVVTDSGELGPYGRDEVVIEFTANPGLTPAPLSKVASGGELSRVRLALEVVLADRAQAATLVFDEVDAGIGGAVGTEVGRRLARLAQWQQVIVVTHLAQVAAFAERHYVVTKTATADVTTTTLTELAEADRPVELARLMGGLADSASARQAARELLDQARAG
jgi:DNA repair protein RecN (Recombination protein N)